MGEMLGRKNIFLELAQEGSIEKERVISGIRIENTIALSINPARHKRALTFLYQEQGSSYIDGLSINEDALRNLPEEFDGFMIQGGNNTIGVSGESATLELPAIPAARKKTIEVINNIVNKNQLRNRITVYDANHNH